MRPATAVLLLTAAAECVHIRLAAPHEIVSVAKLQLDTFVPLPETPALLPFFLNIYEANQRNARASMCVCRALPSSPSRRSHHRLALVRHAG